VLAVKDTGAPIEAKLHLLLTPQPDKGTVVCFMIRSFYPRKEPLLLFH
jgi:hypothetical protein